ncbi:hypothetical protein ODJ79_20750, partial [Actinoplanes sp. KI2]|uniref:hypothetical protein n=1 Tax=Actinoplanes sp. KI2 TaxID=2983315 RepID=UPI0021D5B9BD
MSMRRVAPAIALFFLSPLVAEFLLGDFTLAQLTFVLALAPAYGGAAVVIRELTRRAGRGWPTIILLALAYGVIEEGLETQSLFNPNYLHAHLLDHGFVPALGIAIPWTLFVLSLHTVWSVSTPIALVEEWTTRRVTPWLRLPGLVFFSGMAVAGAVFTFAISYADGHFMASPTQLTITSVVAAALIVTAFRLPRTTAPASAAPASAAPASAAPASAAPASAAPAPVAPRPWVVLVAILVGGFVLFAGDALPAGVGVVLLTVALAGAAVLILRWSRRPGWDGRHRLATAAGALLTYAWHGFLMQPVIASPPALVLVSHAVFALAAVLLVVAEARRVGARTAASAEAGSAAVAEAGSAGVAEAGSLTSRNDRGVTWPMDNVTP